MTRQDETFRQALELHRSGQLAEAERLCQDVLRHQPGHADALYLYGVIAMRTGRIDLGIQQFSRTIAVRPDHADSHVNRGAALAQSGRFEAALSDYDAAIALRPDSADIHANRAAALAKLGRLAAAVASCDRAIALRPDHFVAHYNRGNALRDLRRFAEALASYDSVIALRPELAGAHNNRGTVLADLNRPDEALASFDRAIALRPDAAETWNNRGAVLAELGRLDEALACHDRAIALKPDHAGAHKNRGASLAAMGRLADALASCDRAIALNPDYAEAHADRAAALMALGRPEEALPGCDRAIALKPDAAEAHYAKGACHLALGDFERGWQGLEWRWKSRLGPDSPGLAGAPWLGDTPIDGKTILVQAEQGFGDSLQFCRYVPLLAQRATVLLDVPRPLRRLLAGLDGVARILQDDDPPQRFDAWVPMLSLPLAFRTSMATIPSRVPYLRADADRTEAWRRWLADLPGRKVGLVWAGSPFSRQPRAQAMDRRRSMPLQAFAPLASVPGLCLISLQKGDAAAQARTPPEGMVLHDRTDELDDYADTAALVAALDLVISVDTSVVHLAGALGRPIWVLNRYDQCWRWLRDRTDSPWYPTSRLFQQQIPGDWAWVMREVVEALRQLPAWSGAGLSRLPPPSAPRSPPPLRCR